MSDNAHPASPLANLTAVPGPLSAERESVRQAALAEYGIDRPWSDPGLGRLVQLTARVFSAPVVLVSLVESQRQLFAAAIGVSVCETARGDSFCAHALGARQPLVVPDALQDPRFCDNALVHGPPYIRFYAGCPLVTQQGHVLGTLCVIDTKPRAGLSAPEAANLQDLAALVLDRLELRRLDLARQASQIRFERMAEYSPDAIVCADDAGIITYWNPAAERMTGHAAHDMLGRHVDHLMPPSALQAFRSLAHDDASLQSGPTLELEIRTAAGASLPFELSASLWREDGRLAYCAILRDLSERRRNEERLYRLAHLDPLTELPNRVLLRHRLAEVLEQGQPASVLMVDLDGFKDVNDSLGHAGGDAVLTAAARRLEAVIGPHDVAARMGGDEFAIVAVGLGDAQSAGQLADEVIDALSQVILVEGHPVTIGASVGVALAPRDGMSVPDLLSSADLALYDAKAHGKHGWRAYAPGLRVAAAAKRAYQSELERAVRLGEFLPYYQPIVRLADGQIVGVEATLRWNHPDQGVLPLADFVSALSASPFAARVSHGLLDAACRQVARWRQQLPHLRLSVDVFEAQFRAGDLCARVQALLHDAALPPHALELEVPGQILRAADRDVQRGLQRLREMGVGIAFDDYGTADASLSMLKDFPISRLKIDASFVQGIPHDAVDAALVRAILYLGRSLGFAVSALGLENPVQQARLHRKGCEEGQGPLFGPALPACAFEAMVLPG